MTILVLSALLLTAPAPAAPPTITVGFFDPYAPFSSPLARAKFVERVAGALTSNAERAQGEAYSKAIDLARDIAGGRIQLGLINPQFLRNADRTVDLRPVLVGERNGEIFCPYGLYTSTKSRAKNLLQLRRRRLAVVHTGDTDTQFIFNAVLGGELRDPKFFKRIVSVPDLAGAVGTLKFRKADAFFGPDLDYRTRFKTKGLRRIAVAGTTLCTVLVVDGRLSDDDRRQVLALVQSAMPRLTPLLKLIGLDGLTALPKDALTQLNSALRADPAQFRRAKPKYVKPAEPNETKIIKTIEELEPELLPDPLLLVVKRDGQ